MAHSFTKIWLHAVFSTKNRQPLITPLLTPRLYGFIKTELNLMGCSVVAINGMPDHVHLLFGLNPQKPVTDVMKQLKGASAHWINYENLVAQKFSWQTGYGAFSVSESQLAKVHAYVLAQQEHHRKKTFEQEWQALLQVHRLPVVKEL